MIGNAIRNRRKELGMSMYELAYKVGSKSPSNISRIENDKVDITVSMLYKLSDALFISPYELLRSYTEFKVDPMREKIMSALNFIDEEAKQMVWEYIKNEQYIRHYDAVIERREEARSKKYEKINEERGNKGICK